MIDAIDYIESSLHTSSQHQHITSLCNALAEDGHTIRELMTLFMSSDKGTWIWNSRESRAAQVLRQLSR